MRDVRERWRPHRAYLGGVALLSCAIALEVVLAHPSPESPRRDVRCQALVASLQDVQIYNGRENSAPPKALARARAAGTRGARALLDVLIDKFGTTGPYGQKGTAPPGVRVICFERGPFFADSLLQRTGEALGDIADFSLTQRLLDAFENADYSENLRLAALVALCRPKHAAAFGPLVDFVLDRQTDDSLKAEILYRLPRFHRPAPRRLRELLYLPFSDLDTIAAGTLARMGDPEGASKVLAGLRGEAGQLSWHRDRMYHLALGALRLMGEPPPPRPPAGMQRPGTRRRFFASLLSETTAKLARFLDARPPAGKTEYERARTRYLRSARRTRELSLRSFDDVFRAGDDFDLASASLLLTGHEVDRESILERLDLLARDLRRRLHGITNPEDKIRVLNETLLKRGRIEPTCDKHTAEDSLLSGVLADDCGDCLGGTSLYLAMAERLGLPLHAVIIPEHAFVRYDDGTFRRNIETTDFGKEIPDSRYRLEGGPPSVLRNRTKREVLSQILCNRALGRADFRKFARAKELATEAIRLDPKNENPYVVRAFVTYHSTLDEDGQVLRDADTARKLVPWRVKTQNQYDLFYFALKGPKEAMAALPHASIVRPLCLCRSGDIPHAQECMNKSTALDVRLEVALRKSPGRVRSELAEMTPKGADPPDTWHAAAWVLSEMSGPLSPGAADFLRDVSGEVVGRDLSGYQPLPFSPGVVRFDYDRQDKLVLQAKAFLRLGDPAAARKKMAEAGTCEGTSRLFLETQRLLSSGRGGR